MKKLTVLHFVNLITGKSDGIFTHLLMIIRGVNRDKINIIIAYQGNDIVDRVLRDEGIEYYHIPSLKDKIPLRAFPSLYKLIKLKQVDIIHSHNVKPYLIAGLVNILCRLRHIYNYNGVFISDEYYNFFERIILKFNHRLINIFNSVDVVICPSKLSMAILKDTSKFNCDIISYYNGCTVENPNNYFEAEFVEKLKRIGSKFKIIGVIGRLEKQKNPGFALRIARELINRDPSIYFIFCGDGELKNEMILLSAKLNIEKNVLFTDYVKNVRYYFKFFHCLLFTSDWEGFPLTIWEAMAEGVPVVAQNVGGISEILKEEKCGLVYQHGNINEAVNYLLTLIKNDAYKKELGQKGKNLIREKYNAEQFYSFINNLYLNSLNPFSK
ncbi:MAG: glycosyltransferase [Ignavibacteriaceae bacterium]